MRPVRPNLRPVLRSSPAVNLELLLPDVWIAAHPEHFMEYRRDESEASAARRESLATVQSSVTVRPNHPGRAW